MQPSLRDLCAALVAGALAIGAASAADAPPAASDIFAKIRAIDARTLGTDYRCVQNCTSQGYMYNLCLSKCSYPDVQPAPGYGTSPGGNYTGHGTDYRCVQQCTSQGYMYALCQNRCSF